MKVTLETCILEVGIGRNLFDLEFDKYQALVTDGWMKSLWAFCDKHAISIIDYTTTFPPLLRTNDVYLMEIFVEEGYTDSQLIKLNHCLLCLQALCLSDLANGYGDGFTETYRVKKHTQGNLNTHGLEWLDLEQLQ